MQCTYAILSSVSCAALKYFSTSSHKRIDFRKKKKLLHMKRVFWVSLRLLSSWLYLSFSPFFDWLFLLQLLMFSHLGTILVDPLHRPTHFIMSRILSSSQSFQNTLSLRSARFWDLPIRANTLKLLESGKDSQILNIWIASNYFQLQIFLEW